MRAGLVFKKSLLIACLMMACMFVQFALAAVADPTRPPGLGAMTSTVGNDKHKAPRWVLKSTLISPERRTAVINDRVVSKGDHVNGATVVDIQSLKVRLRSAGREVTLVMLGKDVKTLSIQPKRQ
jgi:MSHA biogenesis protein MshK